MRGKLEINIPVENSDKIKEYVINANKIYDKYFSDKKSYILLGDAHKYNLLKDGDIFVAIDPIGYIAPKEFEIARFIGTVLTENIEGDIKWYLRDTVQSFSTITDSTLLRAALYVDMVFRMHNTTFEDDNDVLRNKWLKILKEMQD